MAESSGRRLTSYLANPGVDEDELKESLLELGLASAEQGELAESAIQPSEIPGQIATSFNNDGSGNLANALALLLANSTGSGRENLKVALEAILGDDPSPVIAGRPIGLLLALTRVN